MTLLGILSFGLVTWTVVITGLAPDSQSGTSNVTYVYVDDSKSVTNINITMSAIKTMSLAKAANEKKVAAINESAEKAKASQMVKLKYIVNPSADGGENEILCKCLCSLNVTIDEVITALEFMQANRELVKVTTTPTPIIEPESNTDDPYEW